MKKRDSMKGLWRIGIGILALSCVSVSAAARDWHELTRLDQAALMDRIRGFQDRLKQDPEDYDTVKGLGIAFHALAKSDAKKFGPVAVETLTKACEIDKKDYEALCYLGSATTMMARTIWNPVKKMSYTNRGIALMDKAVRKAPDNISVRLTRAYNSRNLPAFLEREEIAIEDFERLAEMIKRDPVSYGSIKEEIHTNLAELYQRKDERARAFEMKNRAPGS